MFGVDKYGGHVVGSDVNTEGVEDEEFNYESFEQSVVLSSIDETLVCKVQNEQGEDVDALLTATINPQTGSLQWTSSLLIFNIILIIPEIHSDAMYRRVISQSQMTSMLKDTYRNYCYEKGIQHAIRNKQKDLQKNPLVMDIGAGTGLLSMLSARHGADKVVSCELFEPLCKLAKSVVESNNFSNINILPVKSTQLSVGNQLSEKADVNTYVKKMLTGVGEAVLPTIRHAKKHLLKEDATIVPNRAEVYAQLIQSEQLKNFVNLPEKEIIPGLTFARSEDARTCRGNGTAFPVHATKLPYDALTSPIQVLSFNFQDLSPEESGPEEGISEDERDPGENHWNDVKVRAHTSGVCHGVLFWWKIYLYNEPDTPVLDMSPGTSWWQDHWLQVVYALPEELQVSANQELTMTACHNDFAIWFEVKPAPDSIETASPKKQKTTKRVVDMPICYCGWHMLCNYERLWMLGDSERSASYNKAIVQAIEHIKQKRNHEDVVCLDISDGSLCAMLSAANGANKVFTVESQEVSELIYSQIMGANQLDEITVLSATCDCLTEDDLEQQKIDLLMAEPFYHQMQNHQIASCLSFWFKRTLLDEMLNKETGMVVPSKGFIRCVAVEFNKLMQSHGKAGTVSGFDHKQFDQIQEEWHEHEYTYPLWMYDYKQLTDVFTVGEMDFTQKIHSLDNTVQIPFTQKGTCHAVVMWMDYSLFNQVNVSNQPLSQFNTSNNNMDSTQSTGKSYWKATIKFLKDSVEVSSQAKLAASFSLNHETAVSSIDFRVL